MKTYQLIETKQANTQDLVDMYNNGIIPIGCLLIFYMIILGFILYRDILDQVFPKFMRYGMFVMVFSLVFLFSVLFNCRFCTSDETKMKVQESRLLEQGWVVINDK